MVALQRGALREKLVAFLPNHRIGLRDMIQGRAYGGDIKERRTLGTANVLE